MSSHALRVLGCFIAPFAGAAAIASAASAPPQDGAGDAIARFRAEHPAARFYINPEGITHIYGAAISAGKSPQESAAAFVARHAAVFNVAPEELLPISILEDRRHTTPVMFLPETGEHKFTLVYFSQYKDGYPVFRADLRLLVRNAPGFPLVWAGSALRDLRAFNVPPDAARRLIDFKAARDAARDHAGGAEFVNFTDPELVVWGGLDAAPVAPALCYRFEADTGSVFAGAYRKWLFLVDALTLDEAGRARVVYAEDQVLHVDITGTVQGMATPNHNAAVCSTPVLRPLPYARVTSASGTVYTDANGAFTLPNPGTTPVSVSSGVRGRWFRVYEPGGVDGAVLTQNVAPPGPVNFQHNTGLAENTTAEVNCYIAANIVRDLLLTYQPAFPTIANQQEFPVNVMVSGTCNAFYNGSSINFYPSGGGCNNTGFGTVVHHEYGHHIVACAGSGQGAYGEGFGDTMGVLVTDNPVTGVGFSSCSGGIRTANNTMQYPCSGAIHTCGTLLSGCVWSLRNNLLATDPSTYRSILASLTTSSVLQHQGSTSIDPGITIVFLTLDDNDGNFDTPSPHWSQITSAFAAHNMMPQFQWLSFSYPDGLPSAASPTSATGFRVAVSAGDGTPQPATAVLHVDTGSGFAAFPLSQTAPNVYLASLPSAPCGTQVRFYVSALTAGGNTALDPVAGAAAPYTAVVASSIAQVLVDDFEIDRGWTVGSPADTATTGIWVRVDPVGTAAQPEDDHTPTGTMCYVTGQGQVGGAIGANDVDGGQTTLTSPVLNLAGAGSDARISYWRWYSNDAGSAPNADVFTVDISANNGASWVNVETVGPAGPETHAGWFYHEFNPADFITPTSTVRLRFIASDLGSGSIIEAALDDFRAEIFQCTPTCPADFNQNGTLEPADVAAFVAAWSVGLQTGSLLADFDGNGILSPADVSSFVNAWAAAVANGC
jgi:hypothetical protein